MLEQLTELNRELTVQLRQVLLDFDGEEPFLRLLRGQLAAALNNRYEAAGWYARSWQELADVLRQAPFQYEVGAQRITVFRRDLDAFSGRLPHDLRTLFLYPGIAADVDPGLASELIRAAYYNRLPRVDLGREWDDTIPLLVGHVAPDEDSVPLSYPARRFQVLGALLRTWASAVVSPAGRVDFDVLRAKMLVNEELEAALAEAEGFLAAEAARIRELAAVEAVSEAAYAEMKDVLVSAEAHLVARFSPFLEGVVYDARNELTVRLAARYGELVRAFDQALQHSLAAVALAEGVSVRFDPRPLKQLVLDVALNATAIPQYGGLFTRPAYVRLNGVGPWLEGLLSPSAYGSLRSFSFHQAPWFEAEAATYHENELLFHLMPRLVRHFGVTEPAGLLGRLVHGVPLPVRLGQSLADTVQLAIHNTSRRSEDVIRAIQVRTMGDLLRAREQVVDCHAGLSALLLPYREFLSVPELQRIEGWANWHRHRPNLSSVSTALDSKVGVSTLAVGRAAVPVREILQIPGFPWSREYDSRLFPGLARSDFAGAETSAEAQSYRRFTYGTYPSPWGYGGLSHLGRVQVVDRLVRRLLAGDVPGSADPDELDRVLVARGGALVVDVEELRLHIKGIRAMVARVERAASRACAAAAGDLAAAVADAMTCDEMMALYHDVVLACRQGLTDLLVEETRGHENRDAILAENPVSLRYQREVFDRFVSLVGRAELVAVVGDEAVPIPVREIADALVAYLAQGTEEPVAADDFARFPGLSVSLLRDLHRLEQYLGEQLVVLPRTSAYVPIRSQLSELGLIQLASHLVEEYGAEIRNADGTLDLDALIAVLCDLDRALSTVEADLTAIFEETLAWLGALGGDLTPEALAALCEALNTTRAELAEVASTFLAGLEGDAARDARERLELFANDLYAQLKAERDGVLASRLFTYVSELDGVAVTVSFMLDADKIDRFVAFAERHALPDPGDSGGLSASADLGGTGLLALDSTSGVGAGEPTGFGGPDTLWRPVPRPRFNPEDHPTRFGMTVLLARLAAKFGQFALAVDASGRVVFDMDLFERELLATEQDRAERRLIALRDRELPVAIAFLESLREDDGALPLSQVGDITEHFLGVREQIIPLAADAYGPAAEVWREFVELYEDSLLGGTLSLEESDGRVIFEPGTLDGVLMELFDRGEVAGQVLAQFRDMIESGETRWEYDWSFRDLPYPHWDWTAETGYVAAGGESLWPAAADRPGDSASAAGTFTLGGLAALPGIAPDDLPGLDVAEADALRLSVLDPRVLFLGELNMRVVAPGSGVKVGGLTAANALQDGAAAGIATAAGESAASYDGSRLAATSVRFRRLQLIPAMIRAFGPAVRGPGGRVIPDAFGVALRGELGRADDLYPLEENARLRIVECSADPRNPFLPQLVRQTALQVLGLVDGFRHARVFPWNQGLPGVEALFELDDAPTFDFVLVAGFRTPLPEPAEVWRAAADALGDQWYVDGVYPISPLPRWDELAASNGWHSPGRLAFGIDVAETGTIRPYWRVTAPVVRESVFGLRGGERGAASVLPERLVVSRTTGELIDGLGALARTPHPDALAAVLVPVRFSELSGEGTGPGSGSAAGVRDYVWLRPDSRATAVCLVDASPGADESGSGVASRGSASAADEATEIEVTVDPDDGFVEADETNNWCLVRGTAGVPVAGVFRAVAFLADAGLADDNSAARGVVLHVVGVLVNPTGRVLHLAFPSALQMDFTVGNAYRWSTERVFADVPTEVALNPGQRHRWHLRVPAAVTGVPVDRLDEVTAFLMAGGYSDTCAVVRLPRPVPETPDIEHLAELLPPGGGGLDGVLALVDELIVGAGDVRLPLPWHSPGGLPDETVELALVVPPAGGSLGKSGPFCSYLGDGTFSGQDLVILEAQQEGVAACLMRKLRVGPQAFTLRLDRGWNLVSFPIQPLDDALALLSGVALGPVWRWEDGGFRRAEDIRVGDGFWLYCLEDAEVSFLGEPRGDVRRELAPGWSLIGTVNDLDPSMLEAVAAVHSWDGAAVGYRTPRRMRSGRGYWVFVREHTSLDIR